MMRPRRVRASPAREGASRAEPAYGVPSRASEGAPSGLARVLALARAAGNRALDTVLGRAHGARNAAASSDASRAAERLGAPLGVSGVTVRDDAGAHAAARALGARAATIGDTVLLGEEAPSMSSPAGERLLAHELAHVAQQRAAGGEVRDAVSTRGDAHERAADAAAARAVRGESASPIASGAPAAVQREELSITKTGWLTRADAQAMLQQYLERVLAQQGGHSVTMTDEVKNTLRRMFLNDMTGGLRFEAFLGRSFFPGSPAELAEAIAAYLPDEIDPRQLAHLGISARPQQTTTVGRIGALVKKTAPAETPDQQIAQWEFDRRTKEARAKDKGVVGPYSIDLNRVLNIGRGLGEALHPKPERKPIGPAAPNPALDAAIAGIDRDALVPAEALNTERAGNFADAAEVARSLAAELDGAQAAGNETAMLRLPAEYSGVKDRDRILDVIARIARLVRDALPQKASKVRNLDVYFGERLARRISLAE